jgi:hypothetical protein
VVRLSEALQIDAFTSKGAAEVESFETRFVVFLSIGRGQGRLVTFC